MPNGIQYQIRCADVAGMPPLPGFIFTDPQEAAKMARELGRQRGEKLIVKAITNDQWRKREQQRVINGNYRPVPWAVYDWWRSDMANAIHRDHFPHPSIEKPGWLAYTASAEDGMKDKQTVLRPGSYLKKYFERVMDYYGLSERGLVNEFMLAYGPLEIKFAATEDEIIAVYEHGPDTCMKGKYWPKCGRNPAYIYAAGDLQVAYLGTLEKATARTLVWPEKKIFSRVYGDIARITTGLTRLGYKWGAPVGAKVQKIKVREVKFDPQRGPPVSCFIVPYIDKKNKQGGGHLSVLDKGDHLVICEEGLPGSHHCGLPEGYSGAYVPREDEYPTFTCDYCGSQGHRALHTVYTTEDADEEESWCNKCAGRYSFSCGHSGYRFQTESVETVRVQGGFWTKKSAAMYAAKCEMTGGLYNKETLMKVFWTDGKPKLVSKEWLDFNGGVFRSAFSGRYYLRKDKVLVRSNGPYYNAGHPELKYHVIQCDGCNQYAMLNERVQPNGGDKLFCHACDPAKPPKPQPAKSSPKQNMASLYNELKRGF